jgi:flagellar protein FlbD
MIELTRLQGQKIVVNVELIEFIEETPDTIISTTTGKKLMVRESVNDVIRKAMDYKKKLQFSRRHRGARSAV